MKRLITSILLAFFVAVGVTAWCAEAPKTLIFEAVPGEGADENLARSVTRAQREYMRSTKRTEVEIFLRSSSSVERAIMEKLVTADQVASYATKEDKITVGRKLGFDFVAGSDITYKDDTLTVNLWMSGVSGKKSQNWQTQKVSKTRGAAPNKVDNAVQSATSAAVHEIVPKAFSKTPVVPDEPEAVEIEAAPLPDLSVIQPPSPDELIQQAEESMKRGDLAQAIDQYSKAVNLDPGNGALRLELAGVYLKKGMVNDAFDEMMRAQNAGADPVKVQELGLLIAKAVPAEPDADSPPTTPALPVSPTNTRPAPASPRPPIVSSNAAIAKLNEGDQFFKKSQMPQAIQAYKQAMALSPRDWRGAERLTLALAAVGKFAEAKTAMAELKKVNPDPSPDVLARRYRGLRMAVDKRLRLLIDQYKSDYSAYQQKRLSREKFYNSVQEASATFQEMAAFVDKLQTPPERKEINLRRSLACGLASQAADGMMDYLETDSLKASGNSAAFMSEAESELTAIGDLEATSGRSPAPR